VRRIAAGLCRHGNFGSTAAFRAADRSLQNRSLQIGNIMQAMMSSRLPQIRPVAQLYQAIKR
jgi:hypothetical protein